MSNHPWETEPDSLDFEAEGLPCAIRRINRFGTWCGYVGVGPEHPLFGLPMNHPLRLPDSWFDGRSMREGYGSMDLVMHALSGAKSMGEACPIRLAFEVHGGVSYADDELDGREPGRWWFGFDCAHAGDYLPNAPDIEGTMKMVIESMPEPVRQTMRDIMAKQGRTTVYRDQQYVVGECQSLAAQLVAVVKVLEGVKVDGGSDHRRD